MLALPLAIYATDASGLLTFFNPAAAELAGRSPEIGRDRWCIIWPLRWPDGRPMSQEQCPMAVALKENRPIKGIECIGERANGTRFSFLAHPTPIRDGSGAVVGGVDVLLDITDRKISDSVRRDMVGDLDRKGIAILRLIDAVLMEAERQASGTEAQTIIQDVIRRVATISATQGLLRDAYAATRINSWDFLSYAFGQGRRVGRPLIKLLALCAHALPSSATAAAPRCGSRGDRRYGRAHQPTTRADRRRRAWPSQST
jgi:PAS domain S-box-containing protein